MNPLNLVPLEWRIGFIAGGVLLALGGIAGAGLWLHHQWTAEGAAAATAVLQPKLDKANQDLGTLRAANDANLSTIATLQKEQAANDALTQQYADRVTALNQQADDVAATIRKLQANDQTVADYLNTPVPAALRGVFDNQPAGGSTGAANADSSAPAASGTGAALP